MDINIDKIVKKCYNTSIRGHAFSLCGTAYFVDCNGIFPVKDITMLAYIDNTVELCEAIQKLYTPPPQGRQRQYTYQ